MSDLVSGYEGHPDKPDASEKTDSREDFRPQIRALASKIERYFRETGMRGGKMTFLDKQRAIRDLVDEFIKDSDYGEKGLELYSGVIVWFMEDRDISVMANNGRLI